MDRVHMTAGHELYRAIELDSVVFDFVEQEVGRHDWVRNWSQLKAETDPVARVTTWVKNYGLDVNPADVVKRLDDLAVTGGAWL